MDRAEPSSDRILIHAPIGRDGSASADLLNRLGLSAQVCASFAQLMTEIRNGAAAVFIAEEGLFGRDLTELFGWAEGQPAWSDLPFIILTSRQEQSAVTDWRKRLVQSLGNVSLLERPVQSITLTSAVQAAVRARRRQYQVRQLLEAREQAARDLESLVKVRTADLQASNAQLRQQMQERAQIEAALRQAQKIEAIGQLTGGIAHDFNNLLMVISGGLDILDRQTEPKRRQRLMSGMRQAAQRGAGLTRQLLAFSRKQPLMTQPVDVARQIGEMRDLLDRSLRGDIHVRLEFASDLWPVEVDPGELELVILNLAVNSRDALPDGGTIVISAENRPAVQQPGLSGDFISLVVADTGTGIAPEVRERVFDPFFTTKEVGKGSGLGLAQVYGFAKQSGGTVSIDSEVGRGTRVTLLLPRSTRTPAAHVRSPAQQTYDEHVAGASGHVLVVEDDNEVGSMVAEMLVQLGYEVTRVSSAVAALGALANGRKVDVVFSDIMMPGEMNGIELAHEVRKRRPGLPVLLTSGHAEGARDAIAAEGVRVLPKPYQLSDLSEALRATRGALQ